MNISIGALNDSLPNQLPRMSTEAEHHTAIEYQNSQIQQKPPSQQSHYANLSNREQQRLKQRLATNSKSSNDLRLTGFNSQAIGVDLNQVQNHKTKLASKNLKINSTQSTNDLGKILSETMSPQSQSKQKSKPLAKNP